MIRINLLPAEADLGPTPINPAVPVVAVVLLSALCIGPFHYFQAKKRDTLLDDVKKQRIELDRLQVITQQVDALEAAKKQLADRKGVIQALEDERLRYPQFMDDFSKLLPGNMWLTGLTTVTQAANNTIQVGMDITALDNYAIADLLSNLETSQIFTDIDLGPLSAAQQQSGSQTITFHINTTYKQMNQVPDATKKS